MVFSAITPEWLANIEESVSKELGITIGGVKGTAAKGGITIVWEYDATTQTLTVGDLRKPWFVSETKIEDTLTRVVNEAKPK